MRLLKISAAAAVITVFFLCGQAAAHRINVFAWAEGETVHVTGKFAGGGKISGGAVKVYDENNNLVTEGETDDQGDFSFPVPEISDLKIEISAGPGHKGEWLLSKDELKGEAGDDLPGQSHKKASGQPDGVENTNGNDKYSAGQIRAALDEAVKRAVDEALEERLDRALEKRLAPVMRTLSEIKNPGPGVTEIFGGLGYIIGLFGIAAYVYSRKS